MVSQNYYATEKLKRKIKTGLVVAATGIAAMTAAIGIGKSAKSGESGDSGNKAKIVHVQRPRQVVHEKEVIERERVVVVKDTRELAQAQAAARAAQARADQAMQIAQEEANKRALEESLRRDETDRRMAAEQAAAQAAAQAQAAEQAAAQAQASRSTTVIQLNTVLKTGSRCGGHRMRGPHKNWYRR